MRPRERHRGKAGQEAGRTDRDRVGAGKTREGKTGQKMEGNWVRNGVPGTGGRAGGCEPGEGAGTPERGAGLGQSLWEPQPT